MSKKPLLLFPLEIKAREFPARLFLAGLAVQNGYDVIIGRSKTLHRALYKFPRGIIIENDAQPRSQRFFAKARKMGFKIFSWDEESLVTLTDAIYAQLRVSPQTVALTEAFFCRGTGDVESLQKTYPEVADKFIASGNPRLDILHPKWTGDLVKDEKRPTTILINSRFSIVNPFYISPEKAKGNVFKKFGIPRESETGRHIEGWLDHARDMFLAFAALTEKIAQAFPDYRIIIRPHPSENHGFWKDLADKYDNCESFYEGAAADWFLKADSLVHNSCTTAIEASLTGLPSFAYLPAGDNIYDAALPNSVSQRFYDADSMIAALKELPRLSEDIREKTSLEARKSLSSHIAGIEKSESSAIIFDHIQKTPFEPFHYKMLLWRLYDAFRTNLSAFKQAIINLFKKNEKLKEARVGYAQQKYPGVSEEEITDLLQKYGYSDFKVHPWHHEWHMISPKK